jgi:uncharacterized membrane protein
MARIARLQDEEAFRAVGQGTVVTVRPPADKPSAKEPKELAPEVFGPAFPPRWVPFASSAICVLAFADSAYLTYAHYTSVAALACPTNGFVNCAAVTTSAYSHPFGIPVAVAGLAWSFVMGVLCSPWGWRSAQARWWPWTSRARLAGSVAGVGMVFYLLWAELIKLHHLCEYCTGVHVLTVALFFVVAFGTALAAPAEPEPAA